MVRYQAVRSIGKSVEDKIRTEEGFNLWHSTQLVATKFDQ